MSEEVKEEIVSDEWQKYLGETEKKIEEMKEPSKWERALSLLTCSAVWAKAKSLWIVHETAIFVAGLTLETKAPPKFHDWVVHFPRTEGKKNTSKVITVFPQCVFRGEKMIAVDSGNGQVTRISQIQVGQRLQVPATGEGTLTAHYGPTVRGNGLCWDATDPALGISITVFFLEDGYWEADVFGKAAF